jgi:hypothetical protein
VEGRIGCAEGKGVDRDVSHLAVVDCLGDSEERAVESALSKAVTSVNPDVLVVSTSIHESRKLILRMALQIVCLIAEINVAGNL